MAVWQIIVEARTWGIVATITRTVYDLLGRPISTWIGVNDTTADGNPWSPADNVGAGSQLMTQITGNVYDNGSGK